MPRFTLQEIATLVGGRLETPKDYRADDAIAQITICSVNTLAEAGAHDLSFLSNPRYKSDLKHTAAAAVLLADDGEASSAACPVIRVADPYLAFATLQRAFHPQPCGRGVRHPAAAIDATAKLADDVDVGANAVIGAGVSIGAGTVIGAGVVIEEGVTIGANCLLHAHVTVAHGCVLGNDVILQAGAVIGSDGFGYAWDGRQHVKIPQVGRVILEDGVEIGANTCIDRGAIGDTVIERGVKLDNLIQIAHNVRIGAFSVMASQAGISGSTTVGKGCQFGGQTGLAGHIKVGDGVKLVAQSGVISDLESGGVYAGTPAMPHRLWLKVSALMMKLPEIWKAQRMAARKQGEK